jgi:hypothetical protein
MIDGWRLFDGIDASQFILESISYGRPVEVSLVGAFDTEGRGSRRDIELPLHRDGDYSTDYKGKIDYVCLFCVRSGDATTLIDDGSVVHELNLSENQGVIIDNRACRHGRKGTVGDRILLRLWIEKQDPD